MSCAQPTFGQLYLLLRRALASPCGPAFMTFCCKEWHAFAVCFSQWCFQSCGGRASLQFELKHFLFDRKRLWGNWKRYFSADSADKKGGKANTLSTIWAGWSAWACSTVSLSVGLSGSRTGKWALQLGHDCLSNEKPEACLASNRMETCTKLLRYYMDFVCLCAGLCVGIVCTLFYQQTFAS